MYSIEYLLPFTYYKESLELLILIEVIEELLGRLIALPVLLIEVEFVFLQGEQMQTLRTAVTTGTAVTGSRITQASTKTTSGNKAPWIRSITAPK